LLEHEKHGGAHKRKFQRFFKGRRYGLTSPRSRNVRKSALAAASDRPSRRAGGRCWFDPKPYRWSNIDVIIATIDRRTHSLDIVIEAVLGKRGNDFDHPLEWNHFLSWGVATKIFSQPAARNKKNAGRARAFNQPVR
jgi:hypothetical protein